MADMACSAIAGQSQRGVGPRGCSLVLVSALVCCVWTAPRAATSALAGAPRAQARAPPRRVPRPAAQALLEPAAAARVRVVPDASAVGREVLARVEAAAARALGERGAFALAIPGGSVLKMLAGSKPSWSEKCTLAYVNHKCVAMDDIELATHAKAMKLFLKDWSGCRVLELGGSADGEREATAYEAALRALPEGLLPRDAATGLPVFDLTLVGVGDDGHIGSLYPNREEVLETSRWVLPVAMKTPPSITLSLPVMAAAREVVIAACGVSEKYPQGKSAAMKRAVEGAESLQSFPASGLRRVADYIFDVPAASKLSEAYAGLGA